ncbi:hypothetical protein [Paraburkholderia xenovorans]|uniref:hypothetical protein n=1 Tax=Paraburkholderia xenovorans TaxID=36873 RepID=UPI0038B80068
MWLGRFTICGGVPLKITPGATAIGPSRSMCASWFIFFSQFDDSSVNIWPIAARIGISGRCRILVWIGRIFWSGWRRIVHGIAQLVAFPCRGIRPFSCILVLCFMFR